MEATQHPLESIAPSKHSTSSTEDYRTGKLSQTTQKVKGRPPSLRLSPEDIDHPAIIIDNQLRVVWYNPAAAAKIWHHTIKNRNGSAEPNLFDLLFDQKFCRTVDNWRSWMAFFAGQFRSVMSSRAFRNQVEQIASAKKDILLALIDRHSEESGPVDSLFSGTLRQLLTTGEMVTFHTVAANFKAGRLIVFEPVETDNMQRAGFSKHHIEHCIANVLRHPHPVQMTFFILSAEINQPEILKIEMLDAEYSTMIHTVWSQCISILERHGGIFGKHSDSGFYGYFLPADEFENNVENIIECSLEIKTQMAELSREYKLRRSWSHEIQLNMGLHKEQGYIGALGSSAGCALSGSGVGLQLAAHISSLAASGQILATKPLFDHMPSDVLTKLRFGIYRTESGQRRAFVPRCFSDIRAFTGSNDHFTALNEELNGLSVTQIFDYQD